MKILKKIAAAFVIGTMVFSIAGCKDDNNITEQTNGNVAENNELTADEILSKLNENIQSVKSYNAITNVEGSLDSGDYTSNVGAKSEVDFISEPLYIKKLVSLDDGTGTIQNIETYIKEDSDDSIDIYNNAGGQWIHQRKSSDQVESVVELEDVKSDVKYLIDNIQDIVIADKSSDNKIKLEGSIPSEKIADVVNNLDAFTYVGLSGYSEESYENAEPLKVTLYVDSKTGNLTEISCDLQKTLQTLIDNTMASFPEGSNVTKLTATKYNVSITLSNYNSVSETEIPEDALRTEAFGS